MRLGSIEAGGTKFILAITDEHYRILKRQRVATTKPNETLEACVSFFKKNPVDALGIGSFGPADIKVDSPTYGQILNTPKAGWSHTDVEGSFENSNYFYNGRKCFGLW
ncbi:Fructokinase [Lactiplantibacillus plantarum]|nr:Fructokinase [Lactiplantibacillus plantarum]